MNNNVKVRLYAAWGVLHLVMEIAKENRPDNEVLAQIRDVIKDVDTEE